jgi:hypothetical protein
MAARPGETDRPGAQQCPSRRVVFLDEGVVRHVSYIDILTLTSLLQRLLGRVVRKVGEVDVGATLTSGGLTLIRRSGSDPDRASCSWRT